MSVPPVTTVVKSTEPFFIRRATIFEAGEIGRIAAQTYCPTPFSQVMAPHRYKHPVHWERGFIQRAQKRLLDPRNLTYVVCTVAKPGTPVGLAQFVRLGNDAGAQAHINSSSLVWRIVLWVLAVLYAGWCIVLGWIVGGDKSADPDAVRTFGEWVVNDHKIHWDTHPERENRWHAQSVVVREEFMGRGAGKLLMAEVIKRAEKENVVVGLESSMRGERLYRRVGFELLARFSSEYDFEERAGGVMMVSGLLFKKSMLLT